MKQRHAEQCLNNNNNWLLNRSENGSEIDQYPDSNKKLLDKLLHAKPWNTAKVENKESLAKSSKVMAPRGEKLTAWDQSYYVI